MAERDFVAVQRSYYRHADPEHFRWQADSPYFAAMEAELVNPVTVGTGERLLEIGCGEGGNLFHLRRQPGARFGVDFSPAKAAFAKAAGVADTAAADAARLPFVDGAFDAVLIRDLLHHVSDRAAALAEARRILRPGGRLTVIEPNVHSPLVALQATLIRAERGLFRSNARRLVSELADAGFVLRSSRTAQPLPVERVLLNPRFGWTRLGALRSVQAMLQGLDWVARKVLPQRFWMYLVFVATKPEDR